MDEFTLRQELLNGEDSTRQFKRHLPGRSDLAKEITAFLNTRGGRMFVGVDDDGTICGVQPEDLGQVFDNAISNACSDGIRPPCGVLTENVRTGEGMVVVIEVPDGPSKPYLTSNGSLYVKRGADKRKVTEQSEFRRLLNQNTGEHADLRPVPGSSLHDLDYPALRTYYDKKFVGETLSDLDHEEELTRQLKGIRLMARDQLTIAGALLFAKRPSTLLPSFTVQAIWFKGRDRGGEDFYDSRKLEGTLQSQYEQAMAFASKWNSRVQQGSFNKNGRSEVPETVFEELLVNAFVHRDYAIQDSIKFYIFDDRIEIRSPGTLPNSLTEEEALKGIGRDRNSQMEAFAYDLMNYRGARSGLLRARKSIPGLSLINDVEGEEVTVTIPLKVNPDS
jgi:ATP-dependent DNA helicase RecG